MRTLTSHQTNDCNKALTIEARGEPGAGGAHACYVVRGGDARNRFQLTLRFQQGNPADGINGITNEALLAIVEDRLKGFCGGPFACDDNKMALFHVQDALKWLAQRTGKRIDRGVEGQAVP